jgi:hypothetical protein
MIGRRAHRTGTFVLSLLMAVLGLALIVQAVNGRGGPLWTRLVLGVLFVAGGAGRSYLELRRERRG